MKLISVYEDERAARVLYDLLGERNDAINISHDELPSWDRHVAYVRSRPHPHWYLLESGDTIVGAAYLTRQREVGLFILKKYQDRGFGKAAIEAVKEKHPGKIIANVNPRNERSIKFFTERGFRHIQNTYRLG